MDENGVELFIHVGIDTVKLEGKYFQSDYKTGDSVKKGDVLLRFDKKSIEAEGFDTTTMVIVTNTKDFLDIIPAAERKVKTQETIFTVL